MKLSALFIAVAMVCMAIEGCAVQAPADELTLSQQIEYGITQTNKAVFGDSKPLPLVASVLPSVDEMQSR